MVKFEQHKQAGQF